MDRIYTGTIVHILPIERIHTGSIVILHIIHLSELYEILNNLHSNPPEAEALQNPSHIDQQVMN